MAGAAIGGSHLIQATRAGADYGFSLIWIIFLTLFFKYPFFEYGPRYTAATGESLLHGYLKLGRWALFTFLIFTFFTMFIIETALVIITAGLAAQMFGMELSVITWSTIILAICLFLLMIGKYSLLDKLIKIMIVLLTIFTIYAVINISIHGRNNTVGLFPQTYWNSNGIFFIVALMGWMPSIVDISVWNSLWAIERRKQTAHNPTLKEALFDFNLGYFSAAVLAFAFLILGAMVMFGTNESFSNNGATFANQLIVLYTKNLGAWANPVISIAAFTAIFSSTLTVTDAYPRVLRNTTELLFPNLLKKIKGEKIYFGTMILLAIVTLLIIGFLQSGIKTMIDFATTVSFLTTPALAYINYKVIFMPHIPKEALPGKKLKLLSLCGIAFWSIFALIYIYMRFFR